MYGIVLFASALLIASPANVPPRDDNGLQQETKTQELLTCRPPNNLETTICTLSLYKVGSVSQILEVAQINFRHSEVTSKSAANKRKTKPEEDDRYETAELSSGKLEAPTREDPEGSEIQGGESQTSTPDVQDGGGTIQSAGLETRATNSLTGVEIMLDTKTPSISLKGDHVTCHVAGLYSCEFVLPATTSDSCSDDTDDNSAEHRPLRVFYEIELHAEPSSINMTQIEGKDGTFTTLTCATRTSHEQVQWVWEREDEEGNWSGLTGFASGQRANALSSCLAHVSAYVIKRDSDIDDVRCYVTVGNLSYVDRAAYRFPPLSPIPEKDGDEKTEDTYVNGTNFFTTDLLTNGGLGIILIASSGIALLLVLLLLIQLKRQGGSVLSMRRARTSGGEQPESKEPDEDEVHTSAAMEHEVDVPVVSLAGGDAVEPKFYRQADQGRKENDNSNHDSSPHSKWSEAVVAHAVVAHSAVAHPAVAHSAVAHPAHPAHPAHSPQSPEPLPQAQSVKSGRDSFLFLERVINEISSQAERATARLLSEATGTGTCNDSTNGSSTTTNGSSTTYGSSSNSNIKESKSPHPDPVPDKVTEPTETSKTVPKIRMNQATIVRYQTMLRAREIHAKEELLIKAREVVQKGLGKTLDEFAKQESKSRSDGEHEATVSEGTIEEEVKDPPKTEPDGSPILKHRSPSLPRRPSMSPTRTLLCVDPIGKRARSRSNSPSPSREPSPSPSREATGRKRSTSRQRNSNKPPPHPPRSRSVSMQRSPSQTGRCRSSSRTRSTSRTRSSSRGRFDSNRQSPASSRGLSPSKSGSTLPFSPTNSGQGFYVDRPASGVRSRTPRSPGRSPQARCVKFTSPGRIKSAAHLDKSQRSVGLSSPNRIQSADFLENSPTFVNQAPPKRFKPSCLPCSSPTKQKRLPNYPGFYGSNKQRGDGFNDDMKSTSTENYMSLLDDDDSTVYPPSSRVQGDNYGPMGTKRYISLTSAQPYGRERSQLRAGAISRVSRSLYSANPPAHRSTVPTSNLSKSRLLRKPIIRLPEPEPEPERQTSVCSEQSSEHTYTKDGADDLDSLNTSVGGTCYPPPGSHALPILTSLLAPFLSDSEDSIRESSMLSSENTSRCGPQDIASIKENAANRLQTPESSTYYFPRYDTTFPITRTNPTADSASSVPSYAGLLNKTGPGPKNLSPRYCSPLARKRFGPNPKSAGSVAKYPGSAVRNSIACSGNSSPRAKFTPVSSYAMHKAPPVQRHGAAFPRKEGSQTFDTDLITEEQEPVDPEMSIEPSERDELKMFELLERKIMENGDPLRSISCTSRDSTKTDDFEELERKVYMGEIGSPPSSASCLNKTSPTTLFPNDKSGMYVEYTFNPKNPMNFEGGSAGPMSSPTLFRKGYMSNTSPHLDQFSREPMPLAPTFSNRPQYSSPTTRRTRVRTNSEYS